jgi:hypothetical protein
MADSLHSTTAGSCASVMRAATMTQQHLVGNNFTVTETTVASMSNVVPVPALNAAQYQTDAARADSLSYRRTVP